MISKQILKYKLRFVTFVLLFGYAYIHVRLNGVYIETTLSAVINFSTRLPFAQRILAPAILHFSSSFLPLSPAELFFLMEWTWICLFYFILRKLLTYEFKPQPAQLLSWLFILLLPLITVINYCFTSGGQAPFFYCYDSASLFFITAGFLLCLRRQWYFFMGCLCLATLNRESSILLVLLIPALHWQQFKTALMPMFSAVLVYIFTRLTVLAIVYNTPGSIAEFYFHLSPYTNAEVNLLWLFQDLNILLFIFCFAGLPLIWFGFYDYIPWKYRPLRYVVLIYFTGLLFVGHFFEARIFLEILPLLYLPTCLAVYNWLNNSQSYNCSNLNFFDYLDRFAVITVLIAITVVHVCLNR